MCVQCTLYIERASTGQLEFFKPRKLDTDRSASLLVTVVVPTQRVHRIYIFKKISISNATKKIRSGSGVQSIEPHIGGDFDMHVKSLWCFSFISLWPPPFGGEWGYRVGWNAIWDSIRFVTDWPPSLFSLLSPPNDVTGCTHKIYCCCTFDDGYIFAIEGHSYW